MHPVGFEPTISTGERPQSYVRDRAATGTGKCVSWPLKKLIHWINALNMKHKNEQIFV